MKKLFALPDPLWAIAAAAASVLLAASILFPLWRMELVAPQYPKGLVMYAYGYKFVDSKASPYDDIREINVLNHYIGMRPIEEVTEMKLFVPGVSLLILATVIGSFVAYKRRLVRLLLIAGFWTMPIFFVLDLQYWLYKFGHTMDPNAPLNTGAFTPKVYGTTSVWNFHTENTFQLGFYFMVAAALVIAVLPPLVRWIQAGSPSKASEPVPAAPAQPAAQPKAEAPTGRLTARALLIGLGAGLAAIALSSGSHVSAATQTTSLQAMIDAAAPGSDLVINGGVFKERVVINKPLNLIGHGAPVIDGEGKGDVVTIKASNVYMAGFVVRGSGYTITQEPAGIKVDGVESVTLRFNVVLDSHFGIYVVNSHEVLVEENRIDLGKDRAIQRRGHGVYMWKTHHSALRRNEIENAGDGIHLEFADGNVIAENRVTASRYGLHFMYANENKVLRNVFRDNLAGGVLMFSRELIVKDNDLSYNRKGATGAGLLLKDVDNIFVEGNQLIQNKYGMTAEGTPQTPGASAVFYRNVFALNDTGLGLMSNAPITFIENSMVENTVQVKALGGAIASRILDSHGPTTAPSQTTPAGGHDHHGGSSSSGTTTADATTAPVGAVWAANGRGNYWSDYTGYDADGDGVGDRPYAPVPSFAGKLASNDALRLFQFTLAQQAIDAATRMFPVYQARPVIEDPAPLMQPPVALAFGETDSSKGLAFVSALLLVLAGGAALALGGHDLPRLAGRGSPSGVAVPVSVSKRKGAS